MTRGLRALTTIIEDYKGDNFMINKTIAGIEYKMPKEMADSYLKARKGKDKNMKPVDYLKKVVNEEFGIKGNCVNVITF